MYCTINVRISLKLKLSSSVYATTVSVAVQHWHLARPQLKANRANTAWNESLPRSLHNRVILVLSCWKLARTTSYRPFCTASAICCMLSITEVERRNFPLWKGQIFYCGREEPSSALFFLFQDEDNDQALLAFFSPTRVIWSLGVAFVAFIVIFLLSHSAHSLCGRPHQDLFRTMSLPMILFLDTETGGLKGQCTLGNMSFLKCKPFPEANNAFSECNWFWDNITVIWKFWKME